MAMNLVQFKDARGDRRVGIPSKDGSELRILNGFSSVYDLAFAALKAGRTLAELAETQLSERTEAYDAVVDERRLLVPLDHPDPSRSWVSLTGLTHLGSAKSRDAMHAKLASDPDQLTDSMKMFRLGYEGGKPAPGKIGIAPEWAFKGDGQCLVAPDQPISSPAFASDGGEEAEIAGLYVIDHTGVPVRVGFALGNEFSDHVTERQNYLYLAHSKLRPSSFGPELLVGDLPLDVQGVSRIRRGKTVVWEKPFLSGEQNMSHTIANLEAHHFKYALFRRPGDVHVHYFGTATLSFSEGIKPEKGDWFEIESEAFGLPLRNRLTIGKAAKVKVRAL